jgi:hypothetical protein
MTWSSVMTTLSPAMIMCRMTSLSEKSNRTGLLGQDLPRTLAELRRSR